MFVHVHAHSMPLLVHQRAAVGVHAHALCRLGNKMNYKTMLQEMGTVRSFILMFLKTRLAVPPRHGMQEVTLTFFIHSDYSPVRLLLFRQEVEGDVTGAAWLDCLSLFSHL